MIHNHIITTSVPHSCQGWRLDQTLAYLFPQYSRSYLQHQINQGNVQLNMQCVIKNNHRVVQDQVIQIHFLPKATPDDWQGNSDIPFSIVYEDDTLLIVNKPPGLVTHPAPGHPNHTLANALLHHAPQLSELPRAGIIHRLDKETSGLLVMPKTILAHTYLIKEMAARRIKRYYQAIVIGQLTSGGKIDAPIGRHPISRQKQAILPSGKPAMTYYRIIRQFKGYTWLDIQLETGRTHQIRVHMQHIQHPIIGDVVYSKGQVPQGTRLARQALHAYRLSLMHPVTNCAMQWEAPLPEDMTETLTTLEQNFNLI